MKAIILAGGFAKRMWPLTQDRPKPLLLVAGKPMIEHVIEKLLPIKQIHTIYITTNKRFGHAFQEWLDGQDYDRDIRLVIEEAKSEDEKLGSIGAMKNIIQQERIDDDILCVAGDNLLEDHLHGFLEFFDRQASTVFGLHEKTTGDLTKYGIACVDGNFRVTDFEEKPQDPKSNLVSTAIYAIPRNCLCLIDEYLDEKRNPDAFGHFIAWLHEKSPCYGFTFQQNWFDIGSFENLQKANQYMEGLNVGN